MGTPGGRQICKGGEGVLARTGATNLPLVPGPVAATSVLQFAGVSAAPTRLICKRHAGASRWVTGRAGFGFWRGLLDDGIALGTGRAYPFQSSAL